MRFGFALVFALWTTAAAAQVPFGREDVVETRFGSLQVVGGEVDNFISFGVSPTISCTAHGTRSLPSPGWRMLRWIGR